MEPFWCMDLTPCNLWSRRILGSTDRDNDQTDIDYEQCTIEKRRGKSDSMMFLAQTVKGTLTYFNRVHTAKLIEDLHI